MFAWHEVEGANSLFFRHRIVQQILTYGITRKHNLIGWKETCHAVVGNTYLASFLSQQLIGYPRIRVLLLQQGGNAQTFCHIECRSTGIATYTYCHLWLKIFDNLASHVAALHYFEQNRNVLQQILAIKACYRQPLNGITCGRHTLHFHTSLSTYKKYLCIGAFCAYFVGYRDGWKDMSARTTTTNDDS